MTSLLKKFRKISTQKELFNKAGISKNAAAGWVGLDEKQAAEIINGYGMTELGYLGSKDYRYRFIGFVYQEFVR